MNRTLTGIAALLCVLWVFPSEGIAQSREEPAPPVTKERHERVRKQIETVRIWKLTKELELDEKTSAQLFPLLNRHDRKKTELEQGILMSMRELRQSLSGNKGQIKNILDRIEQQHRDLQREKTAEWDDVKRILSVEQQAKYLLFQSDFQREMSRMITEIRTRRIEPRQ